MSFNLNKVTLAGNVGAEVKVEYLPSSVCKATFPLATNESYKDKSGDKKEKTTWHNIQFWGKVAEIIEKYVKKGSSLYVEGKIENLSWEDKQTGVKKYMTLIRGENFQFIGSAPKSEVVVNTEPEQASNSEVPDHFNDLPF